MKIWLIWKKNQLNPFEILKEFYISCFFRNGYQALFFKLGSEWNQEQKANNKRVTLHHTLTVFDWEIWHVFQPFNFFFSLCNGSFCFTSERRIFTPSTLWAFFKLKTPKTLKIFHFFISGNWKIILLLSIKDGFSTFLFS